MTYFDSVGVEHIPKEIKKFIGHQNVITNIFRIQVYDSIMCGYFRTGFIGFMFKSMTLIHFTNLFLPHNFKKKNELILNYFLIKNKNMNRPKRTFLQLHNPLQFRLRKSKSSRFSYCWNQQQDKVCRKLNKYITALDHANKNLLVFSGASVSLSFWFQVFLFSHLLLSLVLMLGIASASISLVFFICHGIVKNEFENNVEEQN